MGLHYFELARGWLTDDTMEIPSFDSKKRVLTVYVSSARVAVRWSSGQNEPPERSNHWTRAIPAGEPWEQHLNDLLKQVYEALPQKQKPGLMVLSADWVVWRNFELPFASRKKLDAVTPSEMANLAPQFVESGELVCASMTHGIKERNHTAVLAAGIPRQTLLKLAEICAAHGINLQSISLAPINIALMATFLDQPDKEGWVIHNAHGRWTVMAVQNQVIRFVRSSPLVEKQAFRSQLTHFLKHTELAMQSHGVSDFRPTCLWRPTDLGRASQSTEVDEQLQQFAKDLELEIIPIPVDTAILNLGVDLDRDHVEISESRPYLIDMALARHLHQEQVLSLDFLTVMEGLQSFWERHKGVFKVTAALMVGLLGLLAGQLGLSNHRLQNHLQKPGTGLPAHEARLAGTNDVVPTPAALSVLSEQIALPRALARQPLVIDLIHQMAVLTPNDGSIQLNRLNLRPPSISLEGQALDFKSLEGFQQALLNYTVFETVRILSARAATKNQEVTFALSIEMNLEGDLDALPRDNGGDTK